MNESRIDEGAESTSDVPAARAPVTGRRRSLRTLAAAAITAVALAGTGGAVLAATSDGGTGVGGGPGSRGQGGVQPLQQGGQPDGSGFGAPGGQLPPGLTGPPGVLPPTTPPEEDDGAVT